jgi:hypothetical protein
MPIYCFMCDHCGKKLEKNASIKSIPRTVKCSCGARADRDWQAEHLPRPASACVDHASEALAVSPEDIHKEWKADREIDRHSAPDYYDKGGCPHWTGDLGDVMRRKKSYMHQRGFHYRNSY